MQNGPKAIMSARQPRPAVSFAARSKRWVEAFVTHFGGKKGRWMNLPTLIITGRSAGNRTSIGLDKPR